MSAEPVPASERPSWKLAAAVALCMVVLALLGVGLATTRPLLARNYWVALVPVYGLLCAYTAWRRSKGGERLVLRQALHWLGIAGAVALDFYVRGTGVESQVATGLDALMLLALGCYLAGVHLDWSFVGVGLLLTLTLVVVAKANQYLWLLFVAGVLVLGAAAGVRWMRSRSEAPKPLL
jgi:hypothetical protein